MTRTKFRLPALACGALLTISGVVAVVAAPRSVESTNVAPVTSQSAAAARIEKSATNRQPLAFAGVAATHSEINDLLTVEAARARVRAEALALIQAMQTDLLNVKTQVGSLTREGTVIKDRLVGIATAQQQFAAAVQQRIAEAQRRRLANEILQIAYANVEREEKAAEALALAQKKLEISEADLRTFVKTYAEGDGKDKAYVKTLAPLMANDPALGELKFDQGAQTINWGVKWKDTEPKKDEIEKAAKELFNQVLVTVKERVDQPGFNALKINITMGKVGADGADKPPVETIPGPIVHPEAPIYAPVDCAPVVTCQPCPSTCQRERRCRLFSGMGCRSRCR